MEPLQEVRHNQIKLEFHLHLVLNYNHRNEATLMRYLEDINDLSKIKLLMKIEN